MKTILKKPKRYLTMKSLTKIKHLFILSAALAITFSACSSVSNNDVEVDTLSDADVELAAKIVGSSLSDDEDGIVSSMYDAFSNVGETGISYSDDNNKNKPRRNGRSGRGGERSFSHEYDSLTGVHSISYERSVTTDNFSKSLSVSQEIIFTSIDDEFLARPRAEKELIESINFTGTKTGEAESDFRSSNYTKIDTMNVSGIHSTSAILSMDGNHYGAGNVEGELSDSTTGSKVYQIDISYENVAIDKDTVAAYGNLEQGVSGTLTYSILMTETIGGVPEETLVEGTIDLEEDGTALLRFKKLPKVIRFSLRDGERDDTEE